MLTYVDAAYEGDTFMPEIDYSRWRQTGSGRALSGTHSFVTWDRK